MPTRISGLPLYAALHQRLTAFMPPHTNTSKHHQQKKVERYKHVYAASIITTTTAERGKVMGVYAL
jgi:hypothetical protein